VRQFDFARNWKFIKPHLEKQAVVRALTMGMGLLDPRYRPGHPPWLLGRGPLNGQRARRGGLSWHQPWGRCHHIAPFSWALGCELFPDLSWGLYSGDAHTVAVGYRSDWEQPEVVMDILLFRKQTAEESLAFVRSREPEFYPSVIPYLAAFCTTPDVALDMLQRLL